VLMAVPCAQGCFPPHLLPQSREMGLQKFHGVDSKCFPQVKGYALRRTAFLGGLFQLLAAWCIPCFCQAQVWSESRGGWVEVGRK